MGHGSAAASLYRQAGLGAVQGLDVALLVGAQHDSVLGTPDGAHAGLADAGRPRMVRVE